MTPLRAASLALLALVAAGGLVPGAAPRLADAVVWILVLAALPVVAYTVGNGWERASPFRALAPLADRLRGARAPLAYPRALGAWPSVTLVVALTGLEVAGGAAASGATLARLVLAYVVVAFLGMTAFGSERWLAEAEGVTRLMRWWGAFSPRPRAGWLDRVRALPVATGADVAFTVALLYGVNFDGFLATRAGAAALGALAPLGTAGAVAVALVAGYALFLGAFWACARGVRAFAETLVPTPRIAARFAAALLPIAVAYHAAHNLVYAVENAPRLLLVVDDPFGLGWNLLDGVGASSIALPAAAGPWVGAAQILAIVAGHVIAVIVAHGLAFAAFPSRVQAIRSELPLTIVMVLYTFAGLWIVSSGYHAALPGA